MANEPLNKKLGITGHWGSTPHTIGVMPPHTHQDGYNQELTPTSVGRTWREEPRTLLVGRKTVRPLWTAAWHLLGRLAEPPIPWQVHSWERRPGERKRCVHAGTCTRTLTAALFRTAPTWNQPTSIASRRTNCGIPAVGYFPAMKRNRGLMLLRGEGT